MTAIVIPFSLISASNGTESQSELLETILLAMERINNEGGLLPDMWGGPFKLDPVVRDAAGNLTKFEEMAYELFHDQECVAVFGGLLNEERRVISQVS